MFDFAIIFDCVYYDFLMRYFIRYHFKKSYHNELFNLYLFIFQIQMFYFLLLCLFFANYVYKIQILFF